MKNSSETLSTSNTIRDWFACYYYATGMIESAFFFAYLALTPADPKNQWVLGYSKTRIAFFAFLSIAFVTQVILFKFAWNGNQTLSNWLDKTTTERILLTAVFLLIAIPVLLLPSLYFFFDLYHYLGIIYRVALLFIFAGFRFIQLILVAGVQYSQKYRQVQYTRLITRFLLLLWSNLLLANLWSFYLNKLIWDENHSRIVRSYFLFFNFDHELNAPTFFSTALLAIASSLLFIIALHLRKNQGQYLRLWIFLGIIFFYLAIDEVARLHEKLAAPMDNLFDLSGPLGFFPWIIGFIPFLIILGLVYMKFILALPNRTRNLIILSGVIYVLGAIGFELAGGWYTINFGVNKDMRFILYTIEETLEMLGVLLFIFALLDFRMKMLHTKRK